MDRPEYPDYAERLSRAANKSNPDGRRARTRAKLKLAAFSLMREHGIGAVQVTSVTKKGGMAAGTFYTHFDSLDAIVREVVEEFFDTEARPALPMKPADEPFDAMKRGFLDIVRLFRRNILIFKSLAEFRGREPFLRRIWADYDNRWARQLADVVATGKKQAGASGELRIMLGHAALAMVDELLIRILFDRYDDLLVLGDSDETIAEVLALFRYRLLFAGDPPRDKLSVVRALIG